MEVGRSARDGAKSAVQGLFARPTGMITLKMPQVPAGLSSPQREFCLLLARGGNEVKSRSLEG